MTYPTLKECLPAALLSLVQNLAYTALPVVLVSSCDDEISFLALAAAAVFHALLLMLSALNYRRCKLFYYHFQSSFFLSEDKFLREASTHFRLLCVLLAAYAVGSMRHDSQQ